MANLIQPHSFSADALVQHLLAILKTHEDRIQSLEEMNSRLEQEVERLQAEIEKHNGARKDLLNYCRTIEAKFREKLNPLGFDNV